MLGGAASEPAAVQGTPSVRFGVVVEGALRQWQRRCVDVLRDMKGASLELLLSVHSAPRPPRVPPTPAYRLFAALSRPRTRRAAALPHQYGGVPRIALTERGSGQGHAAVRSGGLHFLLAFTDVELADDLLDAPAWGVWRFEFGEGSGQTVLPGFWEIHDGGVSTSAALVRVTSTDTTLLKQGHIRTSIHSCAATAATLDSEIALWPAQVCAAFRRVGPRWRPMQRPPTAGRSPGAGAVARVAFRSLGNAVKLAVRKLLYRDVWNVGIVRAPITRFLEPGYRPLVEWLPPPAPGTFFADPFGMMRDGRLIIVCEGFDYGTGLGYIGCLDGTDPAGARPKVTDLVRTHHLSYPFLLEHDGRIYCIPETHQQEEIALYASDEFPVKWKRVAVLVSGIPAADSTVIHYGDRWWLFCTIDGPAVRHDLHLFHARDLLGPWEPHPRNPVKTDVRSARPGGTPFVHSGSLYRPAQDNSADYGSRVVLNRITCLTPDDFEEEAVVEIEPLRESPYPHGLHTLSAVGSFTLVDSKRRVCVLGPLGLALARSRLRKLLAPGG
jgi:hypothetical protein